MTTTRTRLGYIACTNTEPAPDTRPEWGPRQSGQCPKCGANIWINSNGKFSRHADIRAL